MADVRWTAEFRFHKPELARGGIYHDVNSLSVQEVRALDVASACSFARMEAVRAIEHMPKGWRTHTSFLLSDRSVQVIVKASEPEADE